MKIFILCNNSRFVMKRDEALAFFSKAAASSEGSEKRRYEYILECLEAGDFFIDDELA